MPRNMQGSSLCEDGGVGVEVRGPTCLVLSFLTPKVETSAT